MGKQTSVKIDNKELRRAQDMWGGFVQGSKYLIIATVVVLALLGMIFIDW